MWLLPSNPLLASAGNFFTLQAYILAAGFERFARDMKGFAPMAEVIYDLKDQLDKIQASLLPGEKVEAVFDMKGSGTGFLGVTSHRIIFYDKVFLRRMKAVVSIPYSRIISLAAEDESGILTGRGFFASSKLIINTCRGDHEFEFRGADKAHMAHNMILAHMVET